MFENCFSIEMNTPQTEFKDRLDLKCNECKVCKVISLQMYFITLNPLISQHKHVAGAIERQIL